MLNYWLITDTHFGHRNLEQHCNRPLLFEKLIIKNLYKQLNKGDVLIHLGDVCFSNDIMWHDILIELKQKLNLRLWLCKGNHDHKSNKWYLEHGWNFVCEDFTMKIENKIILFSHKPVVDCGYDLNIHGHFHNSKTDHHEPELVEIKNSRQYLVAVEHTNYCPILVKNIIKETMQNEI